MNAMKPYLKVVLAAVLFVAALSFAALAEDGGITQVQLVNLPDRDVVIITTTRDFVQPDTVVPKLYPTRLEAIFNNTKIEDIKTKNLHGGLVKLVIASQDLSDAVVSVHLDVKGKADPSMFRWSNLSKDTCVLEVFHPLSDKSALTEEMLHPTPPAPPPAPPEVQPAPPPPPVETPAPAFEKPMPVVTGVNFSEGDLTINTTEPAKVDVVTGQFPPSLMLTLTGFRLASEVPTFVTKYYGRIRHITVKQLVDKSGFPQSVTVLAVFDKNPVPTYTVTESPDGLTHTVAFENLLPVVSPAPAPAAPPEVKPAEKPAPAAVVAKPRRTFKIEPEPAAQPAAEQPMREAAAPAPVAGPMVKSVTFDKATLTLTIETSAAADVVATPSKFPPSYTFDITLPLGPGVPPVIAKYVGDVRQVITRQLTARAGEKETSQVIVSFSGGKMLGYTPSVNDGSTLFTYAFSEQVAPVAPEARPAPAPAEEAEPEAPAAPSVEQLMGGEKKEQPKAEEKKISDYPRAPVTQTGTTGQYQLPQFQQGEQPLSDVLINLQAAGGISVFSILNFMSEVSGISIIIDPYITTAPIGGTSNRQPLETLQFNAGQPIAGFREAANFNGNLNFQGGTVVGNFREVPFDTALKLICDSHNFRYKVFRDPKDPYAKPIIYVTSRERLEEETPGANVVDFYQLHYADPGQIYQILYNLDLLPSIYVGWYVYVNPNSNGTSGGGGYGGGGTGGGSFGGGGGGSFGGGGGGFRNASAPGGGAFGVSGDNPLSPAGNYFGSTQQVGPGTGGGGSAGGGRGGFGGGGGGGGTSGGQGAGNQTGLIPLPTAKSGLVIMRGQKETVDQVKEVVRKIDKPPKQASLKVVIYQVTENPSVVYGLLSASYQRKREVVNFSNGALGFQIEPRGGVSFSDNYTAVFEALETEQKAKVVTQTELAVIDGLPAQISISRTRGNFRTSVAFDQNGNAIRQPTFDSVTAQTSLYFLPSIDDQGRVTLYLTPQISAFDGPPQVSPDGSATFQPTTTTQLQTILRMQDGQTAVIGGLTVESSSDQINRVPLVWRLPFIGEVFQHHNKSDSRSYVFITINVTLIDDK